MNKRELLLEYKPRLTERLNKFRLFIEDSIQHGWLPAKVLSFFDDALMMHTEQERFIQAGDGLGAVMSEIREHRENAPETTDIDKRIAELGEIKTDLYQIGENISPV